MSGQTEQTGGQTCKPGTQLSGKTFCSAIYRSFVRKLRRFSRRRKRSHQTFSTMAETAPAPAVSAAKAPKKRSSSKGKKAGPRVSDLILKAVAASHERKGVSLAALKKVLAGGGYDVEKNNSRVKLALKSLVKKGALLQTKGTGASGSFKVSKDAAVKKPDKKPAVKAKKPAPKKPAAKAAKPKKAPAKKAAAKKTPKKVKKPAAAAAKKAVKSPKKAKKPAAKRVTKSPSKKVKAAKPKAAKPKVTKAKKTAAKKK